MIYDSKIVAKHTCTVIHDYRERDCFPLEKVFSRWNKVYFRYEPLGIKYDPDKRTLSIPRGFPLSRLEHWFGTNVTIDKECDPFDAGLNIFLRYLPRNDVQKKTLSFILGNGEYAYTRGKSQLSVNLNTGVGKTYVAVVSAAIMKVRSIMITSSNDWIKQWEDRITEYTDTSKSEIYQLVGIGSIARVLKGLVDISSIKYILASHQTIKSYGDKYGWDKVGELFRKLRVGLKIYDEAHLSFENVSHIDFATNTYKTIYLTATPERSDRDEDEVYQAYFQTVPKIDLFDEDNDPHTHYIAIQYNSHPSPMDIQRCMNRHGLNGHAYAKYCTKSPNFIKMLRIMVEKCLEVNKALVYISTNEAILSIKDWIEYAYPELKGQVGVYTTLIPKEQKPFELEKRIILSTTKSCGAAMDIDGLQLTILLAEPFSSHVLARQSLGRTRGDNTTYIEVVDRGFSAMVNQYKKKLPVFKKYALSDSIIKLDDEDFECMYQRAVEKHTKRISESLNGEDLLHLINILE